MTVLDTPGLGAHEAWSNWYGAPEALFVDRTLQDYPSTITTAMRGKSVIGSVARRARLWGPRAVAAGERFSMCCIFDGVGFSIVAQRSRFMRRVP